MPGDGAGVLSVPKLFKVFLKHNMVATAGRLVPFEAARANPPPHGISRFSSHFCYLLSRVIG